MSQGKIKEWFVNEVEMSALQSELNAFSEQGWEIYQLDRWNSDINIKTFYSIIAFKEQKADCEGCWERANKIDRLKADIAELQNQLTEKDKEIAGLRAELEEEKEFHIHDRYQKVLKDEALYLNRAKRAEKKCKELQNQLTERENEICLKAGEIAELKNDKFTYCAYCGKEFEIEKEGAVEEVSKHIHECEKHPIADYRKQIASLQNQLTETREASWEIQRQNRELKEQSNRFDNESTEKSFEIGRLHEQLTEAQDELNAYKDPKVIKKALYGEGEDAVS